MKTKDKYLIIAGIILCLVIAVLSPFIASSDPDGLEKSAGDSGVPEDFAISVVESPFPDYTMGDTQIGEIAALTLGIVVTLIFGFVVAYIVKKQKS